MAWRVRETIEDHESPNGRGRENVELSKAASSRSGANGKMKSEMRNK